MKNIKQIESRIKSIILVLSELNKQFPKNPLINQLDEHINVLMDDIADGLSFNRSDETAPKHKVSDAVKLTIARKAKLHILTEVRKDLEYQLANRCKLENQKETVEQSIKYIDRKLGYYKKGL